MVEAIETITFVQYLVQNHVNKYSRAIEQISTQR